MRRVVAKLGLGFAEKISIASSSSGSLFMRRSLSSLAEVGIQPEKSLYLCFVENNRYGDKHYVSQVIRPIKLKLISDDEDDEEKCLPVAASQRSTVNMGWTLPNRFGSKIVFPRGIRFGHITHFSCIDTSTENTIKFPRKTTGRFSTPKRNPLLGELNGKLYCLDTCPYLSNPDLHPFEVSTNDDWHPLDRPPFISGSKTYDHFDASFLEGSGKIIGWKRRKYGVYSFDTTMPGKGWKKSFSGLSRTLPFLDYDRPPMFVRQHHPFLGTVHLMFIYDCVGLLVTPFLMSDSYHYFTPSKPLHLPKLCYEYNDYSDYAGAPTPIDFKYKPPITSDFEFVHLGDQKVCLVLNKFFPWDHGRELKHGHLRDTGILLLVTFEYEIITTISNSKPTFQIQTRVLRKHRFRYTLRQVRKPGCPKTNSVHITGAFLL